MDVYQKLASVPKLAFLKADPINPAPGVRTTDQVKEAGIWMLTELMKQDYLLLYKGFFTTTMPLDGQILSPLLSQFTSYEKKRVSDKANGERKYIFTGKGHGRSDDLITSLILLVYWALRFETMPQYGMSSIVKTYRKKTHPLATIQAAINSRTWENLCIQFQVDGRITVSDGNGGLYNISEERMLQSMAVV